MALKIFYPDTVDLPLPQGHRFPAEKYRLLRDRLLADGTITAGELQPSPPVTTDELLTTHDAAYVAAVADGTLSQDIQRSIGLPWSEVLAARSRRTVGGTLAAARAALGGRPGWSGQLAGGTHHAFFDRGAGFCTFNDVAVAANVLLSAGAIDRAAVLDCDVHQGDGNASLLGPKQDVFVASLHGASNYPFEKVPGDLDIALADGTDDDTYLDALFRALDAIGAFRPDILFYISGADPLDDDRLGRLALTFDGLEARDRMVFQFAHRRALPVVIAIGGGYARPIELTVRGYAQTFAAAVEVLGRG
ncbi:MAG: histone deacetylase [Pseudomonadota bacterium]